MTMATDDTSTPSEDSPPAGRQPVPPAKRKRLQQCFEHASKQMSQGSYDYATELFTQCVRGDPANEIYVGNFLANLKRKYDNNKTGAKLAKIKERGARSAVRKALAAEDWDTVVDQGVTVLTVNPWDKATLLAMATVAREMRDDEPEMIYLKSAWEAAPKDPDINRRVADALAERAEFDQAIAALHRVQEAKPDDEDIKRAIASLLVEKTITRNRMEGGDESAGTAADRRDPQQPQRMLSAEEQLERKISRNSEDRDAYFELAELFIAKEDFQAAEAIFQRAIDALGEDTDLAEKQEDAQLRYLRQQVTKAEDKEQRKKLVRKLRQKELHFYQVRSERYPNDLRFKFDLAQRYQMVGDHNEAIKQYQQARNDPRRRGVCMLYLGQCFQKIKQYRLAMSHYDSAIEEIPDRDAENKKDSLYLAGKMAMGLKDARRALKYLTRLAEMDFTYKDVSDLLDKLSDMDDT